MIAKPMTTLNLRYQMIQFLINRVLARRGFPLGFKLSLAGYRSVRRVNEELFMVRTMALFLTFGLLLTFSFLHQLSTL